MDTTERNAGQRSVAVIGSGIAGLTAAHILRREHEVVLFEKDERLGGHADTHLIGGTALDLAFMVFNERNYPMLCRLFGELGVRSRPSEMSMSMFCEQCGLSVLCGSPLRSLPSTVRGVPEEVWRQASGDLRRLALRAGDLVAGGEAGPPLGDLLDRECSAFAAEHLMLPLVSAVWSCGADAARLYPAGHLFRFLDHHGLLPSSEVVRWRTVEGGSRTYVARIAERLAEVLTGTPVRRVRRVTSGVEVRDEAGRVRRFDSAVLAVHPRQALALLDDPTDAERRLLGAVPYTINEAVLHTDASWLPSDPANRASWNHRRRWCADDGQPVIMSYYLNRLQRLDDPVDYILTLNPDRELAPGSVLCRRRYEHPLFTADSTAAAQAVAELSGPRLAYAGAYQGWGFHEDGCLSGVRAAVALGARW